MIEILIAFAVLMVLIAIVIPQFSSIRSRQVLKNASQDALSALSKARAKTLASQDSTTYGVRFESNQIVIFAGTAYSAGASTNEVISVISPASITNVTLAGVSGSSGELYFNRLYGAPSKTGTITITSSSVTKTITISATGTASIN